MRDYNILVLTYHSNYTKPEVFEDFLSSLSFKLGYYDVNKTIKCLTYTEANNNPDIEWCEQEYNDCYVLTDWTQKINPDKLLDAFDDYECLEEVGHYDEEDDWVVDKELEDVQGEYLDKLIKKIRESDIY